MLSEWNRFSADQASNRHDNDPTENFQDWMRMLVDQRANELGDYMSKTWGFNAGPIEAPMSKEEFRQFE